MKKFLLVCFSFVFALSTAMAQERMVSGKVTSPEDGSTLPGVNVVLKGTTNGTVTDVDGNYKLSVPGTGGTLVFSFIGLQTQELVIGDRSVMDMQLGLDVKQLSEVVVTAQGIAREKKALGYSVSTVGQDQIAARPVNDIGRILQGKIPGVVINPTGGSTGSGSSINIRGYSSITGSTQPLWVVDGVPFNTSTNNASGFDTGGTASSSSRFLDIDPNTIENISVLKGLAATVLYGDQGRNGVILVQTKSGATKKRAAEFSFQQSQSITEIASLPDFQNNYGNGFQQFSGVSPVFFSNWGANFKEVDSTGHPFQFISDASIRDAFPQYYFKRTPYAAQPNPAGFFRKGQVSNTAFNMTGGTDKLSYNASVAYTTEQGYAPGNDLKRLNITTGFQAAITDKLTIRTSLLYANTDIASPPLNGATGGGASFGGIPSLYGQFLYTPRSVDVLGMPIETPQEHKQVYYRSGSDIPNPLWVAKYTKETDVTDRFFNATNVTYDFNDHMALTYKVGFDTYTQRQNRQYNKGIGPTYANINNGVLQTQTLTNTIWNHDIIFSFNKDLTPDIKLIARVGGNARNDYQVRDGLYSEKQSVFGLFRHSNFETSSSRSVAFDGRVFYRTTEQQRYGVYGDFSFDYKNFLFVNLAGRNDWNSTIEAGLNSIFYPSMSVAFDATEAFASLKSDKINFLKFRAGYGTSAGFAPTYTTRNIVSQNLRGFSDAAGKVTGEQTIADQLGNLKLRPELQQEVEVGFEAKFLHERLGVDFTVYDRSTKDLITRAPIDPSTGYSSTYTNIGKLSNKGLELALSGTPLIMGDFRWNVILNLTIVRPLVVDLGSSIQQIVLNGFTTRGNYAIAGRPMNIIWGTGIVTVPAGQPYAGQRVVNSEGLYQQAPAIKELGDPNPVYNTSLINNFSFKGVTLSFQFDYRYGGKMYAATPSATIGRGVTKDTDFNRDMVFILPGVKEVTSYTDGTKSYAPNNLQITASNYGFGTQFFGYEEVNMFDATTVRLREVSISYNLPKTLLAKTPFKAISVQLNGNNLWFKALNVPKYVNFDTEVASQGVDGGLGFDYLTGPSVSRYGAVVRFTF